MVELAKDFASYREPPVFEVLLFVYVDICVPEYIQEYHVHAVSAETRKGQGIPWN